MIVDLEKYKDVYSNNLKKGNLGEHVVQCAFKELGYSVIDHNAWDEGVDLLAMQSNSIVVGEVLNWDCRGYIHPRRFMSIVESLKSLGVKDSWLFSFGVCPTAEQKRLLRAYGIKLCYLKDSVKEISKFAINMVARVLRTSTVITVCVCSVRKLCFDVGFCCGLFTASFFGWFGWLRKLKLCRFVRCGAWGKGK